MKMTEQYSVVDCCWVFVGVFMCVCVYFSYRMNAVRVRLCSFQTNKSLPTWAISNPPLNNDLRVFFPPLNEFDEVRRVIRVNVWGMGIRG